MDNKRIISVLMFFTIIFTVIGGSLAAWNWNTSEEQKTNVVFTIEKEFSCAADGGGNITESDVKLAPTLCTDTEKAIKRKVTVTPTLNRDDLTIYMDLWLDVNSIGTGLSESQNFNYVLTTSASSCEEGTIISSGSFNGKTAGSRVNLLRRNEYTSLSVIPETYYLYIWLDAAETSSSTMNQSFSLSLNGSCSDDPSIPEVPDLDDGMIPVTIDNDGTVTTVSKDDTSWYNYDEKQWANAVLVTDASRSTYKGTTGKEISEPDILAYYVWIPRYKYEVWTTEVSATGSEEEINIIFEAADTAMSSGTTVGSYRTHPAFWWDDDSDGVVDAGEMVAGIWVGKFETTGNATTPTVKPNTASLRTQNVSTQFATSQKFTASGNSYGLSNTSTNAHMMKNTEYGAVAYLSHSKYGIQQELYINNSSDKITGRSGGNIGGSVKGLSTQFPGEQTATTKYNKYGYYTWIGQAVSSSGVVGEISDATLGTYASTTGNVTGVYDLSGGAWEHIMGNYNDTTGSSGFSEMPAKKYYDKYTITSVNSCTLATCGGHALFEVKGWYGSFSSFASSSLPWFALGGDYSDGAKAGIFAFDTRNGGSNSDRSWRSVFVVGFGI